MSAPLDREAADVIDREIREMYGITDEIGTLDFLIKKVRMGDPDFFTSNAYTVAAWLAPHLTPRTVPLFDQIMTLLDELDGSADDPRPDETTVAVKREQLMRLFAQVNSLLRLEPLLTAQETFRQSQSARASKPRARLEEDARMIAKAYWAGHTGRAERGRVKELAREYGVTEATIRNYAKKYKPD